MLQKQKATGKSTNWAIFLLCFTAVLREGIEAVVFLAGVSTTESVTAIPIAAVVGILCGLAIGFLLFYTYAFQHPSSSFLAISFFCKTGNTVCKGRIELEFFSPGKYRPLPSSICESSRHIWFQIHLHVAPLSHTILKSSFGIQKSSRSK